LDNGIKEVWDNLTIKQSWLDENRWYDNSFAKEWKQETQKVIKKYKIKEVKEKLDYGK
jgi:Holliday junction resolvase RusA-like endonuclease